MIPRVAIASLFVLLLAACSGPCKLAEGGACSADSECVLAFCKDAACNCDCGVGVAASRVQTEHPCLVALGTNPPGASGCQSSGPQCRCAQPDCSKKRPVCRAGACTSVTDP